MIFKDQNLIKKNHIINKIILIDQHPPIENYLKQ